jgi:predicted RNA-binding Zn-ribbon protein involved in translation (DUF1610 family)
MDREIDHEYTKNIVCPYCGHENRDSWEVEPGQEDIGLTECGSCEKSFYAYRNITIDYSTKEAVYGQCKECGEEDVVEDYHSTLGKYEGLCPACGYKKKRQMEIDYMEQIGKRVQAAKERAANETAPEHG